MNSYQDLIDELQGIKEEIVRHAKVINTVTYQTRDKQGNLNFKKSGDPLLRKRVRTVTYERLQKVEELLSEWSKAGKNGSAKADSIQGGLISVYMSDAYKVMRDIGNLPISKRWRKEKEKMKKLYGWPGKPTGVLSRQYRNTIYRDIKKGGKSPTLMPAPFPLIGYHFVGSGPISKYWAIHRKRPEIGKDYFSYFAKIVEDKNPNIAAFEDVMGSDTDIYPYFGLSRTGAENIQLYMAKMVKKMYDNVVFGVDIDATIVIK